MWAIEETVTTLEETETSCEWEDIIIDSIWDQIKIYILFLSLLSPCSRRGPEKRQEHVGEKERAEVVCGKLKLVTFAAPEKGIFHLVWLGGRI